MELIVVMDSKIQDELRKTQEFADKLEITPYDQVQKNLNEAAAKTAKEITRRMAEAAEQQAVTS